MRNILALAQKELRSYFASPIAYIVLGFWALLYGWFFITILAYFVRASMQAGQFGPQAANVNQQLIRPLVQNVTILVLFLLPMVTMRTYSEEKRSGTIRGEEGCLSIPGIWEEVTRAKKIEVSARDEQGKTHTIEAEDYLARAIQHEVDHLDGVLFVDRLSALKRSFLRRSLEALARGELPEDYKPPTEMIR